MNAPSASARTEVNASPEAVYALVSDLPGMARVAVEVERGSWLGDVTQARVGARFRGHNRRAWRRWTTVSTVTSAEPGRRFAFDVTVAGGIPVSRWQYDIEPTPDGCRVTEQTWDRRPSWLRPLTNFVTGVQDRGEVNSRNMESTLRRLKATVEAAHS
jgi:polyketide cyclase/dehydrase/lipid transport protein